MVCGLLNKSYSPVKTAFFNQHKETANVLLTFSDVENVFCAAYLMANILFLLKP